MLIAHQYAFDWHDAYTTAFFSISRDGFTEAWTWDNL